MGEKLQIRSPMKGFLPTMAATVFTFLVQGVAEGAACDPLRGGSLVEVRIVGSDEGTRAAVLEAVPKKINELIAPRDLVTVESAIYRIGTFRNVTALLVSVPSGCVLELTLEPFPVIASVTIEGSTVFPIATLLSAMQTKVGDIPNLPQLQTDADAIMELYHQAGFAAARIDDVDLSAGNVRIQIQEGRINELHVEGAHRTGEARVRELLAVGPGDLYNIEALQRGQQVLYRSGLFSLVGFGTEPVGDPDRPDALDVTVIVEEFLLPGGSLALQLDRSGTYSRLSHLYRNVGGGHSVHAWAKLDALPPDALAIHGLDTFYDLDAGAAFIQFRPPHRPYNARLGAAYTHTKFRERPERALRYSLDSPLLQSAVGFPLSPSIDGQLLLEVGWFQIKNFDLTLFPQVDVPPYNILSGAQGNLGAAMLWKFTRGLEEPGHIRIQALIEELEYHQPYASLELHGGYDVAAPLGAVRTIFDAGLLSGSEIPYWREFRIGGPARPIATPQGIAFAERYAMLTFNYEVRLVRELLVAMPTWQLLTYKATPTSDFRQSVGVRLGIGPAPFRFWIGAASPFDEELNLVWWTAQVDLAVLAPNPVWR